MELKSANEKHFIIESQRYVAEIERYRGNDPLDAWYQYMVWLEKNYKSDVTTDSLFMRILVNCVATFEADERYKQDRRMIKLFIKYISHCHKGQPEEYFKEMYSQGVGTRVADLYICWAHWFNIAADFTHANQIYTLGFKADAQPFDLLKRAYDAFVVNKSKRNSNTAKPGYEEKVRSQLQRKYDDFISLDLAQESVETATGGSHIKVSAFNHPEAYAIPSVGREIVIPMTPERKPTSSLMQQIVNSCSARKKPLEPRRTQHQSVANRLNFDQEEYSPIPLADPENMYIRGIQLPRNFVTHNLPQRVAIVPPVRDDDLTTTESDVLKLPNYDKIMLLPSTDKSYSPEELMAYRWYKRQNINNQFTAEMDKVWSVGWNVPFRHGEWLVRRNLPQRDQDQHQTEETHSEYTMADGMWRFAFDIRQLYPTDRDSKEEFSREEWLRQKRIKSSKNVGGKSSVLQTINRQKMQAMLLPKIEPGPIPGTSKQDAGHEYASMDISNEAMGNHFGQLVPERKTNRPETTDADHPDVKRNRKTSWEFNELNDTCTTQLFSMNLKSQAVSTPNPKIGHNRRSTNPAASMMAAGPLAHTMGVAPSAEAVVEIKTEKPESNKKFDIFVDESVAAATMEDEVAAEGAGFEIFTDETIAPVDGGNDAQDNVNAEKESGPAAGLGFQIYRDETRIMSEAKKLTADEQSNQVSTAATAKPPVNDENDEGLLNPVPFKPIVSTAKRTELPLKELNASVAAVVEKQQIQNLSYSFAITDAERFILLNKNEEKMDITFEGFDFGDLDTSKKGEKRPSTQDEDLNEPKIVEKRPSMQEEDDGNVHSIYVPRDEVIFSEEKHADWLEVTQHMAEGAEAKNDYETEPVDMNQTRQIIDAKLLNLMKLSPFDPELQQALLNSISFVDRLAKMSKNMCDMVKIVQPLRPKAKLKMAGSTFSIHKMIASGNFGNVFSGECCRTKTMYAFKQERPPNLWEYYICLEVRKRLKDQRIRNGCMFIEYALIGNNATIFASKYSSIGTFVDVCNKVKVSTGHNVDEYVVMVFAKQMLAIVDALHREKIIHGDIKPDNFLLMSRLEYDYDVAELPLQLIDFGQSIDMKRLSPDQVFYSKVKTQNFVCTEMMDNRPWTYQLDLFCLASTIYMMVLGEYMIVRKAGKNSNRYVTRTIPRYYNRTLWPHLFDTLINIPDAQHLPDLNALSNLLDDEIKKLGEKLMRQKITEFNKALKLK